MMALTRKCLERHQPLFLTTLQKALVDRLSQKGPTGASFHMNQTPSCLAPAFSNEGFCTLSNPHLSPHWHRSPSHTHQQAIKHCPNSTVPAQWRSAAYWASAQENYTEKPLGSEPNEL